MKMNCYTLKHRIIWAFAILTTIVSFQNCQPANYTFDATTLNSTSSTEDVYADVTALAYGADAEDRRLLAEKLAGYQPPRISEIVTQWRRISGTTLYNSVKDIIVANMTNSYCYSNLSSSTGSWDKTTLPGTTVQISPGSDSRCIDLPWFAALSWLYMDNPGRLHNATNSGNFNGFISGVKLDQFNHQAVLTSANTDDDEIALIIAMTQDSKGNVLTLSASRSNGGTNAGAKNWRIVARQGNTVLKTFGEMEIGTTNTNGSARGDGKGWNGRMTLVRVERDGNLIRAYTSDWGTNESSLPLDPRSKIEIDLNDNSLGLADFKGKQYYGYGILSQAGSEFRDISVNAWTDDNFVYDLQNNIVYQQQTDGTYRVRADLDAFMQLKANSKVSNPETQKIFQLNKDHSYLLTH